MSSDDGGTCSPANVKSRRCLGRVFSRCNGRGPRERAQTVRREKRESRPGIPMLWQPCPGAIEAHACLNQHLHNRCSPLPIQVAGATRCPVTGRNPASPPSVATELPTVMREGTLHKRISHRPTPDLDLPHLLHTQAALAGPQCSSSCELQCPHICWADVCR